MRVSMNLAVSSLATCRASLRSLSMRASASGPDGRGKYEKPAPLGNGRDPQRVLPGRVKKRKQQPPPLCFLIENHGAAPAKPRNSICVPPVIGKADMPVRLEPFNLEIPAVGEATIEAGPWQGANLVRLGARCQGDYSKKSRSADGQSCCQEAPTTRNGPAAGCPPAA